MPMPTYSELLDTEVPTRSIEKEVPQESNAMTAMPPPALPKGTPPTVITLNFHILVSPSEYKEWDHEGRFDSMTVDEFMHLHNFTDVQHISFKLGMPNGTSWGWNVRPGDEVKFQAVKRNILYKIRNERTRNSSLLDFDIVVGEASFVRAPTVFF